MNGGLSRTQLLTRSVKGGAVLMIAGSVAGTFARRAAADPISDSDLAYARLLVAPSCSPPTSTRGDRREAVRRGETEGPEAGALQRAGALRLGRRRS